MFIVLFSLMCAIFTFYIKLQQRSPYKQVYILHRGFVGTDTQIQPFAEKNDANAEKQRFAFYPPLLLPYVQ